MYQSVGIHSLNSAFVVCYLHSMITKWLLVVTNLVKSLKDMSHNMRKPTFCICENKDADQLRGNREADQRLCFRYIDSTIPLLPIYEISRH